MTKSRRRDDEGFTLVELTITMVIIGAVLLGLITVQAKALGTVALSKQRQTATQLANRYMEQMRALPYVEIAKGLDSTDLTDTNIAAGRFKPAFNSAINDLLVVTTASDLSAKPAPLYPHTVPVASSTVDKIVFDARSYVSAVNEDAVKNGYWLTVVVEWSSFATKGKTKTVANRTRTFSPDGCLSKSTHPFSGPCQSYLYGLSGFSTAGFSVAPVDGTEIFDGLTLQKGSVTFGALTADSQVEQIQSSIGKVTSSGAQLDASTADRVTLSSTADTDPTTGALGAPAAPPSLSNPAGAVSLSGGSRSITASYGGDSGTAYATTVAAAGGACKDDLATIVTSNQLCASGSLLPSGSASLNVAAGQFNGRDLGSFVPTSLAAPASEGRAFSARYTSPGTGHCTAVGTTACMAAGARRTLGTFVGGALPTRSSVLGDVAPTGFTGLVTVSSLSQVAGTEAGPLAPLANSTTTRTGDLSYWNGAGYTALVLTNAAQTLTLPPVTAYYYKSGGALIATVTVRGTLRALAAEVTSTGDANCTTECVRKADSGDVLLELDYTFVGVEEEKGHFTVNSSLGAANASSTYKAAPLA